MEEEEQQQELGSDWVVESRTLGLVLMGAPREWKWNIAPRAEIGTIFGSARERK